MQIYVPSMQRAHDTRTIEDICRAGLEPIVVVPKGEAKDYDVPCSIMEHPTSVKGIANCRQWIVEKTNHDAIVMVDDDLSFHVRRKDDPTKFLSASPKDIRALFKAFEKNLGFYAHVSMIGRQGGHLFTDGDVECSRPWHVFGFYLPVLKKYDIKFGSGLLQDDFDITLQLLEMGCPNLILTQWAVNQHKGHGAPGGAASYRTVDDHNASITRLQQRHPAYVRIVEREYKGDPWLGKRKEAIISWKKAYRDGERL